MKGIIEIYTSEEEYELGNFTRETVNLWVDDGKELTIDFLMGLVSWWNPKDQVEYEGGDSGWDTPRKIGFGTCMFNNSSFARASGMEGIASGNECQYPVEDTYLVSPEDSFLSNEVGTRVTPIITRRDQTAEIKATINAPGDVPVGTDIREFGFFLKSTGPNKDPSLDENSKPYAMMMRAALYGTGYYTNVGGSCVECDSGDIGAVFCYNDEPYTIEGDRTIRWKFGEL